MVVAKGILEMKKVVILFISIVCIVINFVNAYAGEKPYLIVTGDSYSNFFAYLKDGIDYKISKYAQSAKTIEDNKQLMIDAMEDKKSDMVLIGIGVNDHEKNVPIETFENNLKDILKVGTENNKTIFLFSYMTYLWDGSWKHPLYCEDYDKVLRGFASTMKNIYYIDMKDYNSSKYWVEDGYHYNEEFYDAFYDRLNKKIKEVMF